MPFLLCLCDSGGFCIDDGAVRNSLQPFVYDLLTGLEAFRDKPGAAHRGPEFDDPLRGLVVLADVDGSGAPNTADIDYFISWLFQNGPDLNCW